MHYRNTRSDRNRNKHRVTMQTLLILSFTLEANIPIIALLPQAILTTTTRNHNTLSKIIPRTIHQQNLPICRTYSPRTICSIPYPNGRQTHLLYFLAVRHSQFMRVATVDIMPPEPFMASINCLAVYLVLAIATHCVDRKSTRLNSSHSAKSRMPSSA